MNDSVAGNPFEMLLVEDDPGDVRLMQEAVRRSPYNIHMNVVGDGKEALAYLRRQGGYAKAPRPDLVLLDLNLPRMDGRELLAVIKGDVEWKQLPVVILTTSERQEDILHSYRTNANCYITKPLDLPAFFRTVSIINDFWISLVRLPSR